MNLRPRVTGENFAGQVLFCDKLLDTLHGRKLFHVIHTSCNACQEILVTYSSTKWTVSDRFWPFIGSRIAQTSKPEEGSEKQGLHTVMEYESKWLCWMGGERLINNVIFTIMNGKGSHLGIGWKLHVTGGTWGLTTDPYHSEKSLEVVAARQHKWKINSH